MAVVSLVPSLGEAATTLMIAREGFNNVAEITGVATNGTGGFVTRINSGSTGNAGTATVFGSATRTAGATIRTEGTFGGYAQTNITVTALNNGGQVSYTSPGGTNISGVFINDTLVASTNTAVTAGALAGKFFGDSVGPGFVANNGTLTYLANYRDTSGGAITGTAIFSGTAQAVRLKVGDTIPGAGPGTQNSGNVIVAPVAAADNANVILDESGIGGLNVSASGAHYVAVANVARDQRIPTGGSPAFSTQSPADDAVLVRDGSAVLTPSGGILRTDELIAVADGGRTNERLRSILNPKTNDLGGTIFATSGRVGTDSTTDQDLVIVNGRVVARETTDYFGVNVGTTGISPAVDINENGDYAFSFGNQIFVDQTLAIKAGDLIDTDGDGVNDAALGTVAAQGFALGDRLPDGTVDVYFTGRMGTTADYLFRVNVAVPEPTSLAAIGLAGVALLRRRRA